MDKSKLEKTLKEFIQNSPEACVKKEVALRPELAGMRMFDEPIFGYSSASDPLFTEAKKPGIVGPHFMTPEEWLPGAKTVITLYLPIAEHVRAANSQNMEWPAEEWMHCRIDGQAFQDAICLFAEEFLKKEGFSAVAPMPNPRFARGNPEVTDKTDENYYSSNWSERHAAYVAGLGTFSLSKGIITLKGIAGRFLSVITTAEFEPDKRPYTGIHDYCNFCGVCARNCPVQAISVEKKDKSHVLCSGFIMDTVAKKQPPYFGCGKCQIKVPCEKKAPTVK